MKAGPQSSLEEELESEEEEEELELLLDEELEEVELQSVLLRDEYPLVEIDLAPVLPAAAKVKTVAIKVEAKTVDFIVGVVL